MRGYTRVREQDCVVIVGVICGKGGWESGTRGSKVVRGWSCGENEGY